MKKHSVLLYGSSKDLISLRRVELINKYLTLGYDIAEIDAKKSSTSEIEEAFSFGLFDTTKRCVVVDNASKLKNIDQRISEAGANYSLVLVHSGNLTKSLTAVKNKEILEEPPQQHKKQAWASNLFRSMVSSEGKTISKELSDAIVSRVGHDLGVLRWELEKILQVSEQEEITAQEVGLVISPLQEISGMLIIDAIYSCNPRNFLRVMRRLEQTMRYKNMKSFTEGLLFNSMYETYLVCLCVEQKKPYDEISSLLGKNRWVVENKIVPKSLSFGKKRAKGLLRVLFEMEKNVNFEGFDPLTFFKSSVVSVMVF
jgi:DNA polymerase III delta subunit